MQSKVVGTGVTQYKNVNMKIKNSYIGETVQDGKPRL